MLSFLLQEQENEGMEETPVGFHPPRDQETCYNEGGREETGDEGREDLIKIEEISSF